MGRLPKSPDEVVRRLLIEPGVARDLAGNFEYFLDINAAHAQMLQSRDLLTHQEASAICSATEQMRLEGPRAVPIDPDLEDLFFNLEAELMRRVGPAVGGKLHTGRSRNDILATTARMRFKDELHIVLNQLIGLRRTLHTLAHDHVETVVSGYTHLQAAEPITVGHYFSAMLCALERDHQRVIDCLDRADQSPLGSAAMASTTFPINREQTSRSLGFKAPMENSLDGVASRDFAAEALGALAIMTNNLSRFAQDLHVWCTGEFAYAEVDPGIAVTSSIMPQKKNPVTLEHIKSKTAHVQSAFSSCLGALKSAAYSHSRESSLESVSQLWSGISEASAAIELFAHTVENVSLNADTMMTRAAKNFSCVTELANDLVRHRELDFRTAHHIVGDLVASCLEAGVDASGITSSALDDSALKYLDAPLRLTSEEISRALDPRRNVAGRGTLGGPAPDEVLRQLKKLEHRIVQDQSAMNSAMRQEVSMVS